MAGLYVHVPFCAQACSYCDFHFTTKLGDRDRMVDALVAEAEATLPEWREQRFHTLYFGGGTPSLLGAAAIGRIAESAFTHAEWNLREWTVEANPEDLDPDTLSHLRDIGVTRLSIGIQSFDPEVLQWMRRIHTADKAVQAVNDAAAAGFEHISVDLMYGLPVGAEERWAEDVQRACDLPVDHLSCYILTAEPRTLYGRQLEAGNIATPPDELVLRQYDVLCGLASEAGFEHYEVSNFARPGGHSRHNSAYWDGTPYLGIGPGAHSHKGQDRWWNSRSNAAFLKHASTADFPGQRSSEELSGRDRFNEALITGLRRIQGVDPNTLETQTGWTIEPNGALDKLLEDGRCEWVDGRLRIPEKHWPMGDAITLELMR